MDCPSFPQCLEKYLIQGLGGFGMVAARGHGGAQGDGGAVFAQGKQLGFVEILAGTGIGKGQAKAVGSQGSGEQGRKIFIVGCRVDPMTQENPAGFPSQDGVVAAEQEFELGGFFDIDVLGKLGGMLPVLALVYQPHHWVAGMGDQADFIVHQETGLDAAVLFRHNQEGQVDFSGQQHLFQIQGIFFYDLDVDARIAGPEGLEDRGQQEGSPERTDPQDHLASFQFTDVLHFIFGSVEFRQGIPGKLDQPFALVRGTDTAGGPDEQAIAQMGLCHT